MHLFFAWVFLKISVNKIIKFLFIVKNYASMLLLTSFLLFTTMATYSDYISH